ncbi:MAG: creatininase family protein [Promethearchaeota archaeon]
MIKLFFVPIGSYEQHGPHLPPETDFLIAYKLSEYVSSFFKGELIDGIKIGISTEHEGFKNTKSILSGEFITQILNILKNIEGNCKYVFINAHGGNNNVLIEIQKKKKILSFLIHLH